MAVTGLGAILTAIVTPFDDQLRIDEEAFVSLMHHLAEHGSDGFVVAGTSGEASTLDDEEHLGLVELAVREKPAGTTIVAGTGSNDTRHAIALTERATELGVDATLAVTGYYNRPNRRGIVKHYEHVAAATDKPVVLYNIPSRTTVQLAPDLLSELAQIERIDYVKQADAATLGPVDGLGIYAGNDDLLRPVLDMGEAGGICVASHLVGDLMQEMVSATAERRSEIDATLQGLYRVLGVTTNPIPVKAALELLGHRAGPLRLPLVEADEHERAAVAEALRGLGLLT